MLRTSRRVVQTRAVGHAFEQFRSAATTPAVTPASRGGSTADGTDVDSVAVGLMDQGVPRIWTPEVDSADPVFNGRVFGHGAQVESSWPGGTWVTVTPRWRPREGTMGIRTHRVLAAVAIALIGPASAAGQTTPERVGVGAFIGLTEGDGGRGPSAGVSFTYRLAPRLLVEAEAAYGTGLTFGPFPCWPPTSFCARDRAFVLHSQRVLLTATLLIELPRAGRWVRPYVAAGVGYARFAHQVKDLMSPDTPTQRVTRHAPVDAIGGGLLVPLRPRLMVRADARYHVAFGASPTWLIGPGLPDAFQSVRVACSVEARF